MTPNAEPTAGFWHRYAAWSLDATLLMVPVGIVCAPGIVAAAARARVAFASLLETLLPALFGAVADGTSATNAVLAAAHGPAWTQGTAAVQSAIAAMFVSPLLGYAAVALPWRVGFERSRWRASPGKRVFGLQVGDAAQRPLPAGHALQRHLACALSWLTLNVGHAMAALPPDHLALHDRVSATRVFVPAGTRALPPRAKAWLALQALGLACAAFWLAAALERAMQGALDRALGLS